MSIDTQTPGSPGWWLAALGNELIRRKTRLDLLFDYALGDHPLPETTNQASREAFAAFQKKARTNYPALIVEAPRELLRPSGFRTTSGDPDLGDEEANKVWQANGLDADCDLVHGASLIGGEGFVIVGDIDDETGEPLITVEDPHLIVTIPDPLRPRLTRAAMKTYVDLVKREQHTFLYIPGEDGRIEVHQVVRAVPALESFDISETNPEFFAEDYEEEEEPQTLDTKRNPVVRFRNRPQADGTVMGEFEDVIDVIDRINHLTLDRMVISAMQAYRQRAIKGDLPENDVDGNAIDYEALFAPGPDALWRLPDGVDLWESMQADLTPILSAVKDDVRNLGAITRTPPHYMLGDYANASAEAASLARAGLENKVYAKMRELGASWNLVMALAFERKGDSKRAKVSEIETLWTPPERYSLQARADAISKMNNVVPWRSLMQDVYQATPAQLKRMEAEKAEAEKKAEEKALEIAGQQAEAAAKAQAAQPAQPGQPQPKPGAPAPKQPPTPAPKPATGKAA